MNHRRIPVIPIACVIGSASLQAFIPTPGLTLLGWDCKPETPPKAPSEPIETYWDVRYHREMPEYAPGTAPLAVPSPPPVSQAPVDRPIVAATPPPPPVARNPDPPSTPGVNWQPPKPGDPNYSPTDAAAGLYDAQPPAEDCREMGNSGVSCQLVRGGEAL